MRYFKIEIPEGLRSHLCNDMVESIVRIAIRKELALCDIEYLYSAMYPTRRRAVLSLIKYITSNDIEEFNRNTDEVRNAHSNRDCYQITSSSCSGTVFISKV